MEWCSSVWNRYIHPRLSGIAWKILQDCVATEDNLSRRGVNFPSMCRLCRSEEETLEHLIWHCKFSKQLWRWVTKFFSIRYNFQSIMKAIRQGCPFIKQLWNATVISTVIVIWKHRNSIIFEEGVASQQDCRQQIRSQVAWSVELIGQQIHCQTGDTVTLQR